MSRVLMIVPKRKNNKYGFITLVDEHPPTFCPSSSLSLNVLLFFYIFVLPLSMTKHRQSHTHIYTQQEAVAVWRTYFSHKVVTSALSIMSPTHMSLSHRNDQGQKYIPIPVLTSFSPPSQTGVHTHTAKIFHSIDAILPEW